MLARADLCSDMFLISSIATEDEPQQEQTKRRIRHLPTGPRVLVGSRSEQPLKEWKVHAKPYIKGSMKLGGLSLTTGGAVLLAVADESEAATIVAAGPGGKVRDLVYEMHPGSCSYGTSSQRKSRVPLNR
jgi:hypothetical protein